MPAPVGYEPVRCGARTRKGFCNRWAVRGLTKCNLHGAGNAAALRKSERIQRQGRLNRKMVTYGLSVEIGPHEAILEEIARTAGHVRWLENQVNNLEESEIVWGVTGEITRNAFGGENAVSFDEKTWAGIENVWVKLYFRERRHLVDVCEKAIKLGIAEAQVRIAQNLAILLETAMLGVLKDVAVDSSDPRVREAISTRMLEASQRLTNLSASALENA